MLRGRDRGHSLCGPPARSGRTEFVKLRGAPRLRPRFAASYGRPMSSTAIPAPHPIELTVGGDLTRSRLTVFFRGILLLPHLIFVYAWGLVAVVTSILGWIVALFIGRLPDPLHRFLAAYVRYSARVVA